MDSPTTSTIRIRGIRDGLMITLGDGPFAEEIDALMMELDAKQGFLEGSRVTLEVGDHLLTREQLSQAQQRLKENGLELWAVMAKRDRTREAARELGLATRQAGNKTDLNGNVIQTAMEPMPIAAPLPPPPMALFLKETVRSGRSIYHEGPVVIIGDVNPGAEIIAAGDVIVWGKVRGMIHAGAMGNPAAVICALDLTPMQLRIADHIAIPPESHARPGFPEVAAIRGEHIVAEPWKR